MGHLAGCIGRKTGDRDERSYWQGAAEARPPVLVLKRLAAVVRDQLERCDLELLVDAGKQIARRSAVFALLPKKFKNIVGLLRNVTQTLFLKSGIAFHRLQKLRDVVQDVPWMDHMSQSGERDARAE